jgi:membrane-associated protease RseP (regulator of RpoE activity)
MRGSAVVGAIVPDSPAEQAGLQPGDVVEAINGEAVGSIEDAFAVVGQLRPGRVIDIDFSRRVSARTQAMLESAPEDAVADTRSNALPERRSTSYREPPRADDAEPIPPQRENTQDRIRILRRYGDDRFRINPEIDEGDRMDRRELEESLRERERSQAPRERPFRDRPFLRWRRG